MSRPQVTPSSTAPGAAAGQWGPARAGPGAGNPSEQDYAFIALQNAYRPHAGLMRLHNLAACGPVRSQGQECDVEDLVDAGQLFGFTWNDALWIPLFQLDMPGPTVAIGPQAARAALGLQHDGWALASWFVRPHPRLANRSPIECLGTHLPDVLDAAHADRWTTH